MADNIQSKRKAVSDAYPNSGKWKSRVTKMADDQVTAIYLRLKTQGKVQ